MNNKTGLKILVNYQKLTGTSYMCWAFGKTISLHCMYVIISLNLIVLMASIYLAYFTIMETIQDESENLDKISKLVFILYILDYCGYAILMIFIISLLFMRGKSLIQFLYEENFNMNKDKEKKIGFKLVIFQILITIILETQFPIFPLIFNGINNYSINDNIQQYILFLVTENIEMSLISLMAYYCYCIEDKLAQVNNSFTSLLKVKYVSRQIVEIHCSIKNFNKYINIYLFIIIMFSSVSCMTNCVILYFDKGIKHPDSAPSIIEAIIVIFIICYNSERISKKYKTILDKFEQLEINSPLSHLEHVDYATVNRLYSLRDELCFTAFNLYKINAKTLLSIMSLIITFSVILIQTN